MVGRRTLSRNYLGYFAGRDRSGAANSLNSPRRCWMRQEHLRKFVASFWYSADAVQAGDCTQAGFWAARELNRL